LFELFDQAGYSDWIGGLRNDKFQYKSELVGSRCSRGLHCQLQRTAGRGFDCNPNDHIRYCDWPFTFDQLQLQRAGDGRCWSISRKFGSECDDLSKLLHHRT